MVLVSRVTAPFLASTRPGDGSSGRAPLTEVSARMLPTNVRVGAQRGRAAHLPEHVACLGAVDQADRAARRGGEGRSDAWKMNTAFGSPWPSRVTVPVKPIEEAAWYTPGSKVWPPRSVETTVNGIRARRIVVRGGQIGLGLERDGVSDVLGTVDDHPRRETGHRAARADTQIPADDRRTGIGDGGARQHGERRGRSQPHRGLRRPCRRHPAHQDHNCRGSSNRQHEPTAHATCASQMNDRCHEMPPRINDHRWLPYPRITRTAPAFGSVSDRSPATRNVIAGTNCDD